MNFVQYEDLENIVDSLQFDSGTVIAKYETDKYNMELVVEGEVRITYKGELYTTPSDFPQELVDIIKQGNVFSHDDVYVGNNNWLEMYTFDKDGDYICSDVVDLEGASSDDVKESFEYLLKNFLD